MRITQLRYFCAVCQEGGITNAARSLFVSEPTISVAIRELEAEYGVSFFVRERKKLILTEEGRLFYDRARSLLEHVDETDREIRALALRQHPVRVGVSPLSGISAFLPLFTAFRAEHPEIELVCEDFSSTESMNALETGRLDCAIISENRRARESFDCTTLLVSPMVFCAGKHHRLAGRERISLRDLEGENMMLPHPGRYSTGALIYREMEKLGFQPKVSFSTRNLALGIEYLQWDKTVCTVAMEDYARLNEHIMAIPLDPPLYISIVYIQPPDRALSREAAVFSRFVKEFAQKVRDTGFDSVPADGDRQ